MSDGPVGCMTYLSYQDDRSKVVKVDYIFDGDEEDDRRRRLLQSCDETFKQELIANYTAYMNKEESIQAIKFFMNSIDVPVEEVGLTIAIGDCSYCGIHSYKNLDDSDIGDAVNLWFDDPISAENTYGNIGCWNVKKVTNMRSLFANRQHFNEDLSCWDASGVMDMSYMFSGATSFNQNLTKWNVSKVITMLYMFGGNNDPINGAIAFNGDVSKWDTSSVTDM